MNIDEQIASRISTLKETHSWREIADDLEVKFDDARTPNAWRKWFNRRKDPKEEPQEIQLETSEEMDVQSLLESKGLDPDQWQIKTAWLGDKTTVQIVPKSGLTEEDWLGLIQSAPNNYAAKYITQPIGNCLGVVNLYDLHLEKADLKNTSIDVKCEFYLNTIETFIRRMKESQFEIKQVLFPFGHDFGHTDNPHTTTGGTAQDTNISYLLGFRQRVELILEAIRRLADNWYVHVPVVPGNHSRYDDFKLGELLRVKFEGDKRVTVDNGDSPRKYYRWGGTLLGMTHGDQEKTSSLPRLMSVEARQHWGLTKYQEWLTGHLHKRGDTYIPLDEETGIFVRYIHSLSKSDAWHNLKGFVRNNIGGTALIYSDTHHLVNEYPIFLKE